MEPVRLAVLILAALTVGAMTGVMGLYANTIMPGLRRTDDRTFVGAFQAIDMAIINPLFLMTFFGGLVFTGLAVVLHLGEDVRSILPWTVAAFVLYLVVIIATVTINVPLNDRIKAAGHPDDIDVTETRQTFNEVRWVRSNLVRTALTFTAFACLLWALVEAGATTT
ncbi:MAG: DUF1772 domain-containing protein [Acidimicrobiia bacterium]